MLFVLDPAFHTIGISRVACMPLVLWPSDPARIFDLVSLTKLIYTSYVPL